MSYHDELRELLAGIEDGALAEGGIYPGMAGIKEHAERLLAMPEASVEMLVQAAQLGVGAVEAALGTIEPDLAQTMSERFREQYPDGVEEGEE